MQNKHTICFAAHHRACSYHLLRSFDFFFETCTARQYYAREARNINLIFFSFFKTNFKVNLMLLRKGKTRRTFAAQTGWHCRFECMRRDKRQTNARYKIINHIAAAAAASSSQDCFWAWLGLQLCGCCCCCKFFFFLLLHFSFYCSNHSFPGCCEMIAVLAPRDLYASS